MVAIHRAKSKIVDANGNPFELADPDPVYQAINSSVLRRHRDTIRASYDAARTDSEALMRLWAHADRLSPDNANR
ncbi:MAG: hypothetical protein KDA71_16120, partial [Planctomycetales bacterium]|nr:hypothetical protein [Planctomycetales bacterium]